MDDRAENIYFKLGCKLQKHIPLFLSIDAHIGYWNQPEEPKILILKTFSQAVNVLMFGAKS